MSGNFHQKLPAFFEVDIGGHLGLNSTNTPIFEQATLGGTESVRGFRQDEAIGRRMWSLQNELWIPLPGTTNSSAEFQRLLLRSVRLTAFADLGGISKTTGSQAGTRFGPGAGLRFIFNPVVIKLDWAYGLTSANVTTARGRFSFSIVSNLPF
jgi:hemolysin activation/secretion protein